MTEHCTVVRHNDKLQLADRQIEDLLGRYQRIRLSDTTRWTNQTFFFTRQLYNMLQLARVMVQGALARDESRGAHYKPEFPERNDERWLKTTLAQWDEAAAAPRLSYQDVDTSQIPLRARKY